MAFTIQLPSLCFISCCHIHVLLISLQKVQSFPSRESGLPRPYNVGFIKEYQQPPIPTGVAEITPNVRGGYGFFFILFFMKTIFSLKKKKKFN
jgi:hypothetical protein